MVTREEVITNVECMIERLSESLSEDEIKNGWNEKIRVIWLNFFRNMKKDLANGIRISKKPEYTLVFRGMDSHGIIDGKLLEEAINISEQIGELDKLEVKWWSIKNIKLSRCLKYLFFRIIKG